MDHIPNGPNHHMLATLIDQDIAHIRRVMQPSLYGDLGGPILPATYWRKRLHALLDTGHLTNAQLCAVDSLLLQLDVFDSTDSLPIWNAMPLAAHEGHRTAQRNRA
ncbi:hypothetical protein [Paraburkholderia sp.]|jgi:hypothetical protein|uniref:hypothetical protein n=1 Tax=Paraburkholderia sp. TaxID=1926495 RepID=UPI0039C9F2E0